MQPDLSSDLLAFAMTARSLGNAGAAGAAAMAAARAAPAQAEAWLLLLAIEEAEARWERVIELVDAATAFHPHDARIATFRARAFYNLARHVEALAELQRIAREHAGALDALDLLAQITGPFDPPTCLAAVEQAVAEGMTGRDHLILIAADAAAVIGAFERGERLVAALADLAARDRAAAKIATEAATWRAHEQAYDERLAAGTLAPLWELIAAGEKDLARYAATRRLLEHCPAEEHRIIVVLGHELGIVGSRLLAWAAYSTWRHPDHPATLLSYIDVLLAIGAFADAGALLRSLPIAPVGADHLVQRQIFCCACGGLDRETVSRSLASARGLAPETTALALAWLGRSAAAADAPERFDPQDPRAIAMREDPDGSAVRAARRFYVPRTATKPRVALCLSGQLRSFRQTWPQTRAALAAWDPVVFVSTWSKVGAGFGAHDAVDRCLPPAVRDRLPAELRRRTLFEAALPTVAAAMAASDDVTRDDLQEFYGTEHVRLHDEDEFERIHADSPGLRWCDSLNQAKMFFTMADVSALRSSHELHHHRLFDAVFRVRPDRAITYLGERDVERVSTSRIILSDYFMAGAIGDQGMLSGSEVADRLGEIWPMMAAAGSTRFFPGSRGLFNEFLIADYMTHCGVGMRKYLHTHSMGLTPMTAPLAPQWAALIADVAARSALPPEVDGIVTAYCEAAAEEHGATGDPALVQPVPVALVARVAPTLSDRARIFLGAAPRT